MWEMRLYLIQRITAMIMAPMVLIHLGTMIYAIQGGLSAGEILSRTQGSTGWMLLYGAFVVAVAVHAALGLRIIVSEWFGVRGVALTGFAWAAFFGLLWPGLLAVWSVTGAP